MGNPEGKAEPSEVVVRCDDANTLGTAVFAVRRALPGARVVGVLGDEALEAEVRADLFPAREGREAG